MIMGANGLLDANTKVPKRGGKGGGQKKKKSKPGGKFPREAGVDDSGIKSDGGCVCFGGRSGRRGARIRAILSFCLPPFLSLRDGSCCGFDQREAVL